MGWSLPAAFGARIANPEHPAIALIGDGSFLFSCTTLATAYEYDVPIIAVVMDNKSLQIEGEIMNRIYGRKSFTDYVKQSTNEPWGPDCVGMAEALGAKGKHVKTPSELAPTIKEALKSDTSWVIDVDIDAEEPGYRSIWYPYPNDFWLPVDKVDKQF